MQNKLSKKSILLSRTDSIGDVILSLPMAGVLKEIMPEYSVVFLGRSYTRAIIQSCSHVDAFLDWDDLSGKSQEERIALLHSYNVEIVIHVFPRKEIAVFCRQARIKIRVGTQSRFYHWLFCTKLVHLKRKKSDLHEAQLNLKLIRFLGAKDLYSLNEIPSYYGFKANPFTVLPERFEDMFSKKVILLHPKSKGSAREWGLEHFSSLIGLIDKSAYRICITGSEQEGKLMYEFFQRHPEVMNACGLLNLEQLILLISKAECLIAASTGPLHIAAALGIKAIGLFAPIRPMHPGRWAPIGKKARYLVLNKDCNECKGKDECACVKAIEAQKVLNCILESN